MDEWMPIVWALVWIIGGAIGLGFICWVIVASIAARNFKRMSESMDRDFESFGKRFHRF